MRHLARRGGLCVLGADRGWAEMRCVLGAAIAVVLGGCGSDSPSTPRPAMATVAISSDANDQLSALSMSVSLSLTNQAGKTVDLIPASKPQFLEFIHVNGKLEPVLTVSIPQDLYTSATAVINNGVGFSCASAYSDSTGGRGLATFDLGQGGTVPQSSITVTMVQVPLSIDSDHIGIRLKLLAGPSIPAPQCTLNDDGTVTSPPVTPTFTLNTFAIGSDDASSENGALTGIDGQVEQPDAASGSFQIMTYLGLNHSITTDSATQWQGISGLSALQAGEFADIDGMLQADGSVRATRISVMDPAAVSVQSGPVVSYGASETAFELMQIMLQGKGEEFVGAAQFGLASSIFGVSGQLNNLGSLPFSPSFSASSMVAGQNVYVSTPAFVDFANGADYNALATTITLLPQTVDATVSSVESSGDFTVYKVSLASYNLLRNLNALSGEANLLSDPGVMYVYADSSTEVLSAGAPAPGDTLRFIGLVFNDGGTLRMDCAHILNGVAL